MAAVLRSPGHQAADGATLPKFLRFLAELDVAVSEETHEPRWAPAEVSRCHSRGASGRALQNKTQDGREQKPLNVVPQDALNASSPGVRSLKHVALFDETYLNY